MYICWEIWSNWNSRKKQLIYSQTTKKKSKFRLAFNRWCRPFFFFLIFSFHQQKICYSCLMCCEFIFYSTIILGIALLITFRSINFTSSDFSLLHFFKSLLICRLKKFIFTFFYFYFSTSFFFTSTLHCTFFLRNFSSRYTEFSY
jgi:hypothetical protein